MKKYFITGLLIWIPLVITFMVLAWIIGTLDRIMLLVPEAWQPRTLLGFDLPGAGVAITLLIIFATGLVGANVLGQRLVRLWESTLARIPVVKSIYSSVKQVSDTVFSSSSHAFRKTLLIRFPHTGAWTIAFLTGKPGGDAAKHLVGDYLSVYVPTTPNPTSGYFLMVQRSDTIELEMSVDDALKYIISMGAVYPTEKLPKHPASAPKPAPVPE